jgi:hypothetical protein
MLLLLTAVAGLLLPASIERVLSASDAYDVLQIERGSPTPTKDIEHAHRSIAVEVHPASEQQEAAAVAAVVAARVAAAAQEQADVAKAEAEHAAEKEAGRAAEQAAEAQADANKIGSEAARQVALESAAHAAAAARKARAAASNAPSTYDSIEEMLELADLAVCGVSGDGNCGYHACLASWSECSMQHCRPGGRTTVPTQADYASQQALRNACVAWLQQPAQNPMIEMHERSEDSIAAQLNGNMGPPGSMGTYADAAALRAMAAPAVEKVHLVVIDNHKYCSRHWSWTAWQVRLSLSLVLKLSKSGSGVWSPFPLSLDHIWKSGFHLGLGCRGKKTFFFIFVDKLSTIVDNVSKKNVKSVQTPPRSTEHI